MDKRSHQIKKILKKEFPLAQFRVKIQKYSLGENIRIKTDLIKEWTQEDNNNFWRLKSGQAKEITPEIEKTREKMEHNQKIRERIERLLRDFERIARDENGEILAGGNTYLDVVRLE